MKIREFKEGDFFSLVNLAKEMHKESTYSKLNLSANKLLKLGTTIIEQKDYCGFVAVAGDDIIGMFIGYITEYFFGSDKIACDLVLFVPRNRRGGFAASMLLDRYKIWANKQGAKEIKVGITTGVHELATTKLYKKLGFERAGLIYKA